MYLVALVAKLRIHNKIHCWHFEAFCGFHAGLEFLLPPSTYFPSETCRNRLKVSGIRLTDSHFWPTKNSSDLHFAFQCPFVGNFDTLKLWASDLIKQTCLFPPPVGTAITTRSVATVERKTPQKASRRSESASSFSFSRCSAQISFSFIISAKLLAEDWRMKTTKSEKTFYLRNTMCAKVWRAMIV